MGRIYELVRGSVEEMLNELLEAETEKLTQAVPYERVSGAPPQVPLLYFSVFFHAVFPFAASQGSEKTRAFSLPRFVSLCLTFI